MKLILQFPFVNDYKNGYLSVNGESRQTVCLVRFDNTKTSISYARYLMSCYVGRYLNDNEQVDHKDNDKTNDIINNLQILTVKENNQKRLCDLKITRKLVKMSCPSCGKIFVREHNKTHLVGKSKTHSLCSQKCVHILNGFKYTKDKLINIGKSQIIEIYRK